MTPDPPRPPHYPPRAASHYALDAIRRKAQVADLKAQRLRQPEPGIFCATYPLPAGLGEPTERSYRTSSPVLGLPVEVLEWHDKDTGKRTVIHRFRVRIHGFDP